MSTFNLLPETSASYMGLVQYSLAAAAVLSAVTTAVGICVQGRLASKQIRATVVSSNRQNWINSLREEVSELISLVEAFDRNTRTLLPSRETSQEAQRRRLDFEDRANLMLRRIQLRLNEGEQDHLDLIGLLQKFVAAMRHDAILEDRIIKLTQKILKAEWNRVKRGD